MRTFFAACLALQGLELRDGAGERRPAAAARIRGGGENFSRDGREGEVG